MERKKRSFEKIEKSVGYEGILNYLGRKIFKLVFIFYLKKITFFFFFSVLIIFFFFFFIKFLIIFQIFKNKKNYIY